jgi:hypothetical protein
MKVTIDLGRNMTGYRSFTVEVGAEETLPTFDRLVCALNQATGATIDIADAVKAERAACVACIQRANGNDAWCNKEDVIARIRAH